MAKLKDGEKRVQLSFVRPDDLALHEYLEKQAYELRYDVQTFIVLALHDAFKHVLNGGNNANQAGGSDVFPE